MSWIIISLLSGSTILGLFILLRRIIKKSSKNIVENFNAKHGESLRFVSGCGIVDRYNRVPGVFGITDYSIIYEPSIIGDDGEISISHIKDFEIEDTEGSTYRRARKYRNAKVIAINTLAGETRLFVMTIENAERCAEILSKSVKK